MSAESGIDANDSTPWRPRSLEALATLVQKGAICAMLGSALAVFFVVLIGAESPVYLARWTLFLSFAVLLVGSGMHVVASSLRGGFAGRARAVLGFVTVATIATLLALWLLPPAP